MLVNAVPPRQSVEVLGMEMAIAAADGRLAYYLDQPVLAETLTATAPHPFFVMDASTIAEDGVAPTAAQYAGWRYLLEVNRRAVALATIVVDEDGNHRYGGIGIGPAISAIVFAIHAADELLRSTSEDFTIAALEFYAVHTVLLRVANRDRSQTAFLPLGLATSLSPARLYSPAQIGRELRRMASPVAPEPSDGEPVGG